MRYSSHRHHRRSTRYRDYDYTTPGAYFITTCVQNFECMFGVIADEGIHLNAFGQIVAEQWRDLPARFPHIELDQYIVMPNHFHGIVVITEHRRGEVTSPLQLRGPNPGSLGQIIAYFKYCTTQSINVLRDVPGEKLWQRNYWDRIIRDIDELDRIRNYIHANPLRWQDDQLHPHAAPNRFNRH